MKSDLDAGRGVVAEPFATFFELEGVEEPRLRLLVQKQVQALQQIFFLQRIFQQQLQPGLIFFSHGGNFRCDRFAVRKR